MQRSFAGLCWPAPIPSGAVYGKKWSSWSLDISIWFWSQVSTLNSLIIRPIMLRDRVCPGRHFAVSSLWFFTAGLVASFDISKALDNQGNEITPPLDFLEGFVRYVVSSYTFPDANSSLRLRIQSHPKHFKCSITPRSEKITNIILNSKLWQRCDAYAFLEWIPNCFLSAAPLYWSFSDLSWIGCIAFSHFQLQGLSPTLVSVFVKLFKSYS